MKHKAIYAGTFDPITFGHIDLIQRASSLFSPVVVAVAESNGKQTMLNINERISLAKKALSNFNDVEIVGFRGLLIDIAKQQSAKILIRGLRVISDFDYEFQMAATNRMLMADLETIFLSPAERYTYISSSLVREIASMGGDIRVFVPEVVANYLYRKLNVAR